MAVKKTTKKTTKLKTKKKIKIVEDNSSASFDYYSYVIEWLRNNKFNIALGVVSFLMLVVIILVFSLYKNMALIDSQERIIQSNSQDLQHKEEDDSDDYYDIEVIKERKVYKGGDNGIVLSALSAKLGKDKESIIMEINLFNGSHLKGQYDIYSGGDNSSPLWNTFYGVKFNNAWNIVSTDDDYPLCSDLAKYNFPKDILYPCDGEDNWENDLEEEIFDVFAARYDENEIDYTEIVQKEGDFIRGNLFTTTEEHIFYLKKSSDGWNVVYEGLGIGDCGLLKGAGFPDSMYDSYCYPEYEIIR